ncbi:mannose-6-phosphate isomerase, type 1 [Mariniphaga anaerophila]|uniref:Mannose-6-phosphate isomerase, type 1 n=1 Tax=Mariniphaga anaerophila TaxID=1484053 RepID=A0A1M5F4W9_9BACT|nr:type I phosphomannose isomerase catalytic subunit [Mariniphaga anaerophila]SHF86589.1 mannose-6-phosphate isomerase, type 1 [Mariniphaga anaerophila]
MPGLYPLKFKPIFLEKIWGGNRMKSALGKDYGTLPNCGESWELSAVEGSVSEVSNGFLAGNSLTELVEIYMGELVGDKIYKKYGIEFPLLFKFIDAQDNLSIQVHPNDELAAERHNAYGKTEMWYVIDAEKGALINSGFNRQLTRDQYLDYLKNGKLPEILHYDKTMPGDVFFIPAGRVHAICKGVLLAEIQQTSDVTYRIYDYDRKDANGNVRELHNDLALDAIDFSYLDDYKTKYTVTENQSSEMVSCDYFTTNLLKFSKEIDKDYNSVDSFIVYMNLDGRFAIEFEGGEEIVEKGETVLVPASLETFNLKPLTQEVTALEVYIK